MSWSFNICSHKFIFFPNHSTLTDKCLWTLFFHLILHANHLNVEWNHIKWLNWMFRSLFLAIYFNLLNKKSFRAQFSFHRHCFLFFLCYKQVIIMELQWVLGAPEKLQVDHVIYGLGDSKFEPVHQFYEDLSLFVSSAQHSIF